MKIFTNLASIANATYGELTVFRNSCEKTFFQLYTTLFSVILVRRVNFS